MIRPYGIPEELDVRLEESGKPGSRTFYHDFPTEPGRRMSIAVFEDGADVQERVRHLADAAEESLRDGGAVTLWRDRFIEQAVAERAGAAILTELAKLGG